MRGRGYSLRAPVLPRNSAQQHAPSGAIARSDAPRLVLVLVLLFLALVLGGLLLVLHLLVLVLGRFLLVVRELLLVVLGLVLVTVRLVVTDLVAIVRHLRLVVFDLVLVLTDLVHVVIDAALVARVLDLRVPGIVDVDLRVLDVRDRNRRRRDANPRVVVIARRVPDAAFGPPVHAVAVEHRLVVVGDDLHARFDLHQLRRDIVRLRGRMHLRSASAANRRQHRRK